MLLFEASRGFPCKKRELEVFWFYRRDFGKKTGLIGICPIGYEHKGPVLKFCKLFFIGLVFFSGTLQAQKPNLLFIMTDQQRFDALSRWQQEMGMPLESQIKTPNMDKLSREGAYFRNAYTPSAVCGPARTSILLGSTIENTGVRSNWLASQDNVNQPGNDAKQKIAGLKSYDEILVKDNGYKAEYYGKWHAPESKGYGVYDNDVRAAGADEAWFGKTNKDGSKHMSWGLHRHFKHWLDTSGINKSVAKSGQQMNTWTDRPYITDPLDLWHGEAPKLSDYSRGQPDIHGMDLVPDGFSVTALEGQETVDALERLNASGKPWSLTVSFHYPHAPMTPTAKYYNMYNPDNMIPPANLDSRDNSAYANANGRKRLTDLYHDEASVQRWMANYYGLVTEIDDWIGKILAKLDELGQTDNTLIIFTSDHGEMLGSHGLREKNIFLEESAHVPLFIKFPGTITRGLVIEEPVSNVDLHATITDYLGINTDQQNDSRSLRRYIERTHSGDDFVVTEWNFTDSEHVIAPGSEPAFMIRKGDYKLIVPNLASSSVMDMAFNLKTDPHEMNNMLGSNAGSLNADDIGKMEHLKALLVSRLTETNDPAVTEVVKRQTWPSLDFWVGDTELDFGEVYPGASNDERLYLGTSTNDSLNVTGASLEGADASHFAVEWTAAVIPGNSGKSMKVTYTGPLAGNTVSNARLILTTDAGTRPVQLKGSTAAPAGTPFTQAKSNFRISKKGTRSL